MAFKQCSIGAKGPKVCQENIPYTITPPPPAWTIETRQDGSMLSRSLRKILTLHLNVAAEIETHQTRQHFPIFYCPILVILCELFPVLIWQKRHPVWSSAAVVHLLQGLMCCVFRDGILQILVVTSGYLSYCCLSIISNSLSILLWPLTSTRHFGPHNCRSLDIFSFLDHSP